GRYRADDSNRERTDRMKKVIVITLVAVAATIILLSVVAKSQIQAEQPERTQSTITTELEAKEIMTTVNVITNPTTSITTSAPVNTEILAVCGTLSDTFPGVTNTSVMIPFSESQV
ncbi:MAG: hypothetical protein ACI4HJ_07620, partial [Ruminococcus sp.]